MSIDDMSQQKSEVPHGTLDLLVLRTLAVMGPLLGYAIARRIEQASGDTLQLSQGSGKVDVLMPCHSRIWKCVPTGFCFS
jgi:hypothetical protein